MHENTRESWGAAVIGGDDTLASRARRWSLRASLAWTVAIAATAAIPLALPLASPEINRFEILAACMPGFEAGDFFARVHAH